MTHTLPCPANREKEHFTHDQTSCVTNVTNQETFKEIVNNPQEQTLPTEIQTSATGAENQDTRSRSAEPSKTQAKF
jgi:hypothetical protein